jgi:hypothetical protein
LNTQDDEAGAEVTIDNTKNAKNEYYRFVKWVQGTENLAEAADAVGTIKDGVFTPTMPEGGWKANTTYTAVVEKAPAVITVGDDPTVYTSWGDISPDKITENTPVTVTLCDNTDTSDPVIAELLKNLKDPDNTDEYVLDLNGKTLSPDPTADPKPVIVVDGNDFTVQDSDPDKKGELKLPIEVKCDSSLTLDGCKVDPDGADSVYDSDLELPAVILVDEGGKLVLEDEAKVNGDADNNVVGIIVKNENGNGVIVDEGLQDIVVSHGTVSYGGRVSVGMEVLSTFTVRIPKTITLSSEGSGSYTISACGDVAGTEVVQVVPQESFTMSSTGKSDITAVVAQKAADTVWTSKELYILDDEGTLTGTDKPGTVVMKKKPSAGEWSGTLSFTIAFHKHSYVDGTCSECGSLKH